MRTTLALMIAGLTLAGPAWAQETPKPKDSITKAGAETPRLSPAELEAKFIATLSKATMSGRWCLIQNGTLTPEKDEKYTIIGARKLEGDSWMIAAKMNYGGREIVAPIPVKVQWAGDTPVIIVDKMTVPGGGTYSARVLIYEHTYAGTWSGGGKVGLLSGMITNEKEAPAKEPARE